MGRRRPARPEHRRLVTEEPTRVTSLFLPVSLLRRVQATAKRLNWSQAEIHRQALETWLAQHPTLTRPRGAAR